MTGPVCLGLVEFTYAKRLIVGLLGLCCPLSVTVTDLGSRWGKIKVPCYITRSECDYPLQADLKSASTDITSGRVHLDV